MPATPPAAPRPSPRPRAAATAASLLALALAATGCAGTPAGTPADPRAPFAPEPDELGARGAPAPAAVGVVAVPEAFLSPSTPVENIDTPAAWRGPDGRTLLFASSKQGHRLGVYDGDDGRFLRWFGEPGEGVGAFNRPNGLAVHGDRLYVVERDNHRVQVFALPSLAPLGAFGADVLRAPYGLWLDDATGGGVTAYITDSFMYGPEYDQVPADAELAERVKVFALDFGADGRLREAPVVRMVGAAGGDGALRVVESIAGDPAHDRLLIAEEHVPTGTRLREYGLADARWRGDVGAAQFTAQAEGIALWGCADGSGYWIATDQAAPHTVFHVYDRASLAHLGSFRGDTVANTDGIWLQQAPTARFPAGVFYAVHDDKGVGAFDWRDVARALGLREACPAG